MIARVTPDESVRIVLAAALVLRPLAIRRTPYSVSGSPGCTSSVMLPIFAADRIVSCG